MRSAYLLTFVIALCAGACNVQSAPKANEPTTKVAAEKVAPEPPHDQWISLPDGQVMYHAFASAPYPHSTRADGYKRNGKVYSASEHYSDSTVGIFIPKTFKPTSAVNYIVHFHGHNHHVSQVLPEYHLDSQLVMAKVNAILIIPQLPFNAPDDGGGKLEMDPNGLKNLLTDVTTYLHEQNKIPSTALGKVVITAHSGGYNTAACVLDHGGLSNNITDCILFDASYGTLGYFAAWAAKPGHRLISFHTQHLDAANKKLMDMLTKAKTPYVEFPDTQLTPEKIRARTAYFVTTTLKHDEVPYKKDFAKITLSTSALAGE